MKIRTRSRWILTLALAGMALSLDCASDADKSNSSATSPTSDEQDVTLASEVAPGTSAPLTDAEPTQIVPPEPVATSPGIDEIVKLAQANVDEEVILAYINGANIPYHPSADEVLYLGDIGLSPRLVAALIHRGKVLQELAAQAPLAASSAVLSSEPAANPAVLPSAPQAGLSAQPVAALTPAVYVPDGQDVPDAYPQPDQALDLGYFYESLAPYGSWMDIPDYGWVWQPSVVTTLPDWRPYGNHGRWLYTDAGWYWQSDYSWGWAPFHYGRWLHHARCGWLWLPDAVWGPAWVCWRRTPLYCGWAPLPPAAAYQLGRGFTFYGVGVGSDCDFGLGFSAFAFIAYRHFPDRHPHDYFLPPGEAGAVFHQSTLANNYFLGPNRTIINAGISRDQVAAFSRSELRKVTLRDLPPGSGKYIKPDRLEREGNTLVIYRPTLRVGARPVRPALAMAQPASHFTAVKRNPPTSGSSGNRPTSNLPMAQLAEAPAPLSPAPAYQSLYPRAARGVGAASSDPARIVPVPPPPAAKPLTAVPSPKLVETRPNPWAGWPNAAAPGAPAAGRAPTVAPVRGALVTSEAPWAPAYPVSSGPNRVAAPAAPDPVRSIFPVNPSRGQKLPKPAAVERSAAISIPPGYRVGAPTTASGPVNPVPEWYRGPSTTTPSPVYQAPAYRPAPTAPVIQPSAPAVSAPVPRAVERPAPRPVSPPTMTVPPRASDSSASRATPRPSSDTARK